ncbi:hypothetical protein KXW39_005072 [Aspergillus fumigatus]|nr:hypothetical protein KXX29_004999 [Aspergillus fumigatus]KAH2066174.1 hypothetical protein KXW32_003840 [Aspergillus fumigatus]KAH2531338.1 hypothetical protein KXW12_004503 [Aspergillus fumigatus]KAH2569395.1 hypothetical protein KXV99_005574 [Aspergillus fumigatus]KAH3218730.1 hypothetical protein KXV86_009330 [Aspergillus fumigatus]
MSHPTWQTDSPLVIYRPIRRQSASLPGNEVTSQAPQTSQLAVNAVKNSKGSSGPDPATGQATIEQCVLRAALEPRPLAASRDQILSPTDETAANPEDRDKTLNPSRNLVRVNPA